MTECGIGGRRKTYIFVKYAEIFLINPYGFVYCMKEVSIL